MPILKLCIFSLISSYLCLVFSQVVSRDVVIEQGSLRGYNDDDSRVFSFYGIPYATAPRGEDTYKAPLPPKSWSGVFNATIKDLICPQLNIANYRFFGDIQFDCLIVNVFAPNTIETNLPVFVYIHPGGHRAGKGVDFDPMALAIKGIVAVTFNYRLAAYGFLCLGTEFAPGNAGLKDQSAALKWIRNNIAQFGGNPDNILIAGSSSASKCAELHIISPMSDGLFQKVALESSSAINFYSIDQNPLATAETFARAHGVETGQDLQALEDFYKSLTYEPSIEVCDGVGIYTGFRPCIESHSLDGVEKFLSALPLDIIKNGDYEKRPMLSGFTSMEGLWNLVQFDIIKPMMEDNFAQLVPTDIPYDSETDRLEKVQKIKDFYFPTGEITNKGFVEFFTDSIYLYPHVLSARLHSGNSAPVFLYLWTFKGTLNFPEVYSLPIYGPAHTIQSSYLLNFSKVVGYDKMVAEDYLLQDRIRQVYLNFATYGKPIPSRTQLLDVEWLPVAAGADNYLEFDVDLRSGQYPLGERLALWDQIYDKATKDSPTTNTMTNVLAVLCLLIAALNLWI